MTITKRTQEKSYKYNSLGAKCLTCILSPYTHACCLHASTRHEAMNTNGLLVSCLDLIIFWLIFVRI